MPRLKRELAKAVRRYRRFHLRPPSAVRSIDLPEPKALVFLGEAFAIEYVSDKVLMSGDRQLPVERRYRHVFGRNVKLYTDPKGRVLYIKGGRMRAVDWLRD